MAEVGKFQAIKILNNSNSKSEMISDDELFNMQFMGEGYRIIESITLKQCAQIWERNVVTNDRSNLWADRIESLTTKRKLRVAYMSADFCNHPVGRFIMPIIKSHDRNKFEIIGINCCKTMTKT